MLVELVDKFQQGGEISAERPYQQSIAFLVRYDGEFLAAHNGQRLAEQLFHRHIPQTRLAEQFLRQARYKRLRVPAGPELPAHLV